MNILESWIMNDALYNIWKSKICDFLSIGAATAGSERRIASSVHTAAHRSLAASGRSVHSTAKGHYSLAYKETSGSVRAAAERLPRACAHLPSDVRAAAERLPRACK